MNCNTTHYRANSSSVPGDPTGTRIGDEGFAALASSEHLGRLRDLGVYGVGAGSAAVRAIAASDRLPSLRSLSFEGEPLGDAGGRVLCDSPHLSGLRTLRLRDCGIGGDVLAALRERFGDALRV